MELTTATLSRDKAKIEQAWSDGKLTYRGVNLFDLLLEQGGYTEIEKRLGFGRNHRQDDEEWTTSGQEVYLGYSPNLDSFLAGFDVWDPEAASALVTFKVRDDGGLLIISVEHFPHIFYKQGSGYAAVGMRHSEMLDIRLD